MKFTCALLTELISFGLVLAIIFCAVAMGIFVGWL